MLFSVVIPVFDRAAVLGRAIESVLRQTHEDFELLVIDDGSRDGTAEVVHSYRDPRIRYFYQSNRGPSAARNRGIEQAQGVFVAFLDSDDSVAPEWLAYLARLCQEESVGVACCACLVCRESERDGLEVIATRRPRRLGPLYEDQTALFTIGAFAARRDLLLSVGGYAEELAFAENTELALRLLPRCVREGWRVTSTQEPLVVYRWRSEGRSRSPETSEAQLEATKWILAHHGERIMKRDPVGYANYCAIGGVSAARLGRFGEARRLLRKAVRVNPGKWKHWARALGALVPPLGRRVWLSRAPNAAE